MKPEKTDYGTYKVDIEDSSGKLRSFEFERWNAGESTDTLIDIMGILGEAVGSLGDIQRRAKSADEVPDATFQALMKGLTSNLSRDKVLAKKLIRKMSSDRVLCDGANIEYETFYQEDLALSFAVVRANIEVQYGNFFAAAGRVLGLTRPAKQALPKSA